MTTKRIRTNDHGHNVTITEESVSETPRRSLSDISNLPRKQSLSKITRSSSLREDTIDDVENSVVSIAEGGIDTRRYGASGNAEGAYFFFCIFFFNEFFLYFLQHQKYIMLT